MKAISIHLTDVCNSKCTFCIVDSPYMQQDTIMRRRVSRFLRENADQGYELVSLHGGEATIRRDFLEIVDEIRELGYPAVAVQTNARKLARMSYARTVVGKGVSLFIVSLHGATAETQDRISLAPGSFDQAVQGIRNVRELGATVRTNSVVCKDNYPELPELVDLCLDLGADMVHLSALHTGGTAKRNFWQVTPRYDEIQPYVLEACRRVVSRRGRLELWGFPQCTIPGYERYLRDWRQHRYKVLYRNSVMDDYEDNMDEFSRVKDGRCASCVFDSVCGGVYKEYAELIGWDEFHPVTEAPADLPLQVA
jgi:MoaA/NifB/PqqE/SkfB family radical SAM enzyme